MLDCHGCGKPFVPARSDARYCSNGCRQQAYRERHGQRGRYVPITPEYRAAQDAANQAFVERERVKAVLLECLTAKRPTVPQLREALRATVVYLDEYP